MFSLPHAIVALFNLCLLMGVVWITRKISFETPRLRKIRPYRWALSVMMAITTLLSIGRIFTAEGPLVDTRNVAAAIQKQTKPGLITDGVRFDSVTAPDKGSLRFQFTLMDLSGDSADLEIDKAAISAELDEKRCSDSEFAELRSLNVTVTMAYNIANGSEIVRWTTAPGDCS